MLRLHVGDRGTGGSEAAKSGTPALWKQTIMQAEECRVLHRCDRVHVVLLCIVKIARFNVRYVSILRYSDFLREMCD